MQDANSVSKTRRFELDWPVFMLKSARTILTLGGKKKKKKPKANNTNYLDPGNR